MTETNKHKTMTFQSIRDIDVKDKNVIVRVDLNVPVKDGKVTDDTRIVRAKPTIDYLKKSGAKIIVASHFGRPKGQKNPDDSLEFLTRPLAELWDCDVVFSPDTIGENAREKAKALKPGCILLLENLRFDAGEEENSSEFSRQLAELGDLYVNDAFSVSHRAHASTEGITHFLPAAAGLLMEEELIALDQAIGNAKSPVMAITGGSKISTKLNILKNLVEKTDYLVLGGAMANTFAFAQGMDVGASMHEADMAQEAKDILAHARSNNCEIIVPKDFVIARELTEGANTEIVKNDQIPQDKMALDVGPDTLGYIEEKLDQCKTVVWNGPMGVFEVKPFDKGTNTLAQMVAQRTKSGNCISVAGGGDTASALENAGVKDDLTYISSAGGAFLEWLEGKTLPGVKALYQASKAA